MPSVRVFADSSRSTRDTADDRRAPATSFPSVQTSELCPRLRNDAPVHPGRRAIADPLKPRRMRYGDAWFPKAAEIKQSLFGAREGHTHTIEQEDYRGRHLTHGFCRRLIGKKVAAVDRVIKMFPG